jgi:8-oxo-dGTP pyrophosphatase MutT (NUDIX family)
MKRYVAGFLINGNYVYLVRKLKPAHLAGKLNAIGGKIEPTETAFAAMQREWREETGTEVFVWNEFCRLRGNYALDKGKRVLFEVVFYWSGVSTELPPRRNDAEEYMAWYNISLLLADPNRFDLMPNCTWLIPMALSLSRGDDRADSFVVTEQYVL